MTPEGVTLINYGHTYVASVAIRVARYVAAGVHRRDHLTGHGIVGSG